MQNTLMFSALTLRVPSPLFKPSQTFIRPIFFPFVIDPGGGGGLYIWRPMKNVRQRFEKRMAPNMLLRFMVDGWYQDRIIAYRCSRGHQA